MGKRYVECYIIIQIVINYTVIDLQGIKTLQGILLNLEASHGGVGISLETVTSITTEIEQHKKEAKVVSRVTLVA